MLRNANVTAVVPGGKKCIPGISFPNYIKFLDIFPHKEWNRGTGATELSKESPGLSQPCGTSSCAGNPPCRKSRKNQELIKGKPQGPTGG